MTVKRMKVIFQMIEIDENDEAERIVTSECDFDDGAVHGDVAEKFNDFLRGCGYVWDVNDGYRFTRFDKETHCYDVEERVYE